MMTMPEMIGMFLFVLETYNFPEHAFVIPDMLSLFPLLQSLLFIKPTEPLQTVVR